MISFDLTLLINWVTSGVIGLFFGIISAWITYRYQRKRDDLAWEREKEKLQKQFEFDLQQKIEEQKQKSFQEQTSQIRAELLKGIENPAKTLNEVEMAHKEFYTNAENRAIRILKMETNDPTLIVRLLSQITQLLNKFQQNEKEAIPKNVFDSLSNVITQLEDIIHDEEFYKNP